MEDYYKYSDQLTCDLFQNIGKLTGNVSKNTSKFTSRTDRMRSGGVPWGLGRGIHSGEARTLESLWGAPPVPLGCHGSPWGQGPQEVQPSVPSSHYELGRLYSYRGYSYYRFLPMFTRLVLQDYYSYKTVLTRMGLSWENILLLLFSPIFRTFLGEYS